MTRDQAADIIAIAFRKIDPQPETTDDLAIAQRIAVALDALGLLIYAADPRLNQPARATSNTSKPYAADEIAATARIVSGDLLGNEVQHHSAWATKRAR